MGKTGSKQESDMVWPKKNQICYEDDKCNELSEAGRNEWIREALARQMIFELRPRP